jgi:thiol-disulfide isomerase/thioredoxin
MYLLRLGPRFLILFLACGCVSLVPIGCSQEEEKLTPDPGASPFYPGPAAQKAAPTGAGASASQAAASVEPDSSSAQTATVENDVVRELRLALRSGQKGDLATALKLMDHVLEVEPLNREALAGRTALAIDQARAQTSLADRAASIDKAGALMRTLFRVYERQTPGERQLFGQVLFNQVRTRAEQSRIDDAIAILKEANETGIDLYAPVEADKSLEAFRKTGQYRDAFKARNARILAAAHSRVDDVLSQHFAFPYSFTLSDIDGNQVSLADFKGKVVVVDYWGTWCGPCRETIPHLIDLYRTHREHGFEIIGLCYEQGIESEAEARAKLKPFVKENGITYPCLIGDEATIKQLPKFSGFPTTVVLDRTGKVRYFVTENQQNTIIVIKDIVEVLLAEPAAPAPAAADAKKPG